MTGLQLAADYFGSRTFFVCFLLLGISGIDLPDANLSNITAAGTNPQMTNSQTKICQNNQPFHVHLILLCVASCMSEL